MTPDSAALLGVLLAVAEVFLLITWAVERRQRRERMRLDAWHHCKPGCGCRGSIEGRRPR